MMRKPNRVRLASGEALLLFCEASGCWFATIAAVRPERTAMSAGVRRIVSATQRAPKDGASW
jgi:hypothetical protein